MESGHDPALAARVPAHSPYSVSMTASSCVLFSCGSTSVAVVRHTHARQGGHDEDRHAHARDRAGSDNRRARRRQSRPMASWAGPPGCPDCRRNDWHREDFLDVTRGTPDYRRKTSGLHSGKVRRLPPPGTRTSCRSTALSITRGWRRRPALCRATSAATFIHWVARFTTCWPAARRFQTAI